jgi:hypothetical protein
LGETYRLRRSGKHWCALKRKNSRLAHPARKAHAGDLKSDGLLAGK